MSKEYTLEEKIAAAVTFGDVVRKTNQEVLEEKEYDYSEVPEVLLDKAFEALNFPDYSMDDYVSSFLKDEYAMREYSEVVSELLEGMERTDFFNLKMERDSFDELMEKSFEGEDVDEEIIKLGDELAREFLEDIQESRGVYTVNELVEKVKDESLNYQEAFVRSIRMNNDKNRSFEKIGSLKLEDIKESIIVPKEEDLLNLEIMLKDKMDTSDLENIIIVKANHTSAVYHKGEKMYEVDEKVADTAALSCEDGQRLEIKRNKLRR